MSGACAPAARDWSTAAGAAPAKSAVPAAAGSPLDWRAKRCPATSATRATSAIPATGHGRTDEKLRESEDCDEAPARAGVPHRWQYFAPGVSGASHAAHLAPARG